MLLNRTKQLRVFTLLRTESYKKQWHGCVFLLC
jgi:hypothetical protein